MRVARKVSVPYHRFKEEPQEEGGGGGGGGFVKQAPKIISSKGSPKPRKHRHKGGRVYTAVF